MGMDMSSSASSMDAADMSMVFFASSSTPLYSSAWTPASTGQYAGTCVFLILLAVVFRTLFAAKHLAEQHWLTKAVNRRYVVVADRAPESERISTDADSKTGILTANGIEESVKVVHAPTMRLQPWRFSVDLPRALLATLIAGIGYLLMLAVMSLNVGYFLSVLAGTFVGELAVGRYNQMQSEHH